MFPPLSPSTSPEAAGGMSSRSMEAMAAAAAAAAPLPPTVLRREPREIFLAELARVSRAWEGVVAEVEAVAVDTREETVEEEEEP